MFRTTVAIASCLVVLLCHSDAELTRVKRATLHKADKHDDSDDMVRAPKLPLKSGLAAGALDGTPKLKFGTENQAAPKHAADSGKEKPQIRLEDTVECADDVKRFCSDRMQSNNFMILDCLQDSQKTHDKVSENCHHFLWNYKVNLTKDIRFDTASEEACKAELSRISECNYLPRGQGQVIPCLIEHYDEIETSSCQSYINKMATIIFSDFRFMAPFVSDCNEDIAKYHCGRLEPSEEDDSPHSQGHVVACLNKKDDLQTKCKTALLKVAEIQADDYHLDRPLYYACKADREVLCATTVAGSGQVFKCLYNHMGDKLMSKKCRVKLEERQQLIAEDVKADKSFYESCKKDIKENGCAKKRDIKNHPDELEEDLNRSNILLCLEQAQNNGVQLESQCVKEMFDLRSELMQDYKISPELVSACQDEIDHFCDGLDPDGESVHCLMEAAKEKSKDAKKNFSDKCRVEVAKLLHIANPGEDIRLDPPLQRACGEVVTSACHDRKKGHGDVITCLLDNLDHEDMTDECEEKLLEIQYFAVRDFQLDHNLFKQCKKDAKELCHEQGDFKSMTPDQGPLVFTCLHRLYRSEDPKDKKPSRSCIHEIRRVMRERGARINLNPEVEQHCIKDLSEFCSDNDEHTEEGAEMECLQLHLEDLRSKKCQEAVTKFTSEEMEDLEMDQILMKHCTPMIKRFCQGQLESDAMPNEVLQCLISNKNAKEMDAMCAAGIEHHQIISLKDFKFNHKFREACQDAVQTLCKDKNTKFEVVSCLSEHVRNDTLMEAEHRIDRHCRKQLKAELLERSESIKLDPELNKACEDDVSKFCSGVKAGEAQVIECLKNHKRKLSSSCHKMIFKRQQEEAQFGDYTFLHVCKKMIKTYCRLDASEPELMDCLKEHKDNFDFDEHCRKIVIQREVEESEDYRLDPHLQKACRLDIRKHCSKVLKDVKNGEEMDGRVINCLKKKFTLKDKVLTKDCEHEVRSRIKEAAIDINLNPVVMKMCKEDIKKSCSDKVANVRHMSVDSDDGYGTYETFGHGAVIECLKKNFHTLRNNDCKTEIAYMIAESRVDVHIDPLLNSACQKELVVLCSSVSQGQGRQMSCLLAHLESDPQGLGRNCREMIRRRKELWEYAAQVAPPESFSEIYEEISASPARNYLLAILFSVVGIVFIMGLTCGRVTKRVRAELKNK
ncbi:Golgi apparatus protein 1 [Aplysia californica]|uniref:Golgi apparatus protein 1 n=1 Tax=Aplysia californica TaxID=6500 RepID=A0ABM1ACD6_APLCA|nr:Golgi apparatus protein 1 [Aplysia californica]